MPRTFRFEHFTVARSNPSRGLRRRDKQYLSQKRAAERPVDRSLHYGHNHAETEELYNVRVMNAQLEALAGLSANAPMKPTATHRGQPIGAIPLPAVPELGHASSLRDMVDEVLRQFRAVQSGIEDATRATSRLLSLPMEVARVAAQRLRPAQG